MFDSYIVTKEGSIISKFTGKEKSFHSCKKGYQRCCLTVDGKKKSFLVHRVVALVHLPNPENKPQINHKDGNKKNNNVWNLEWTTDKENVEHSVATGLVKRGKERPNAKLSDEEVLELRRLREEEHLTYYELGRRFNIAYQTAHKVCTRQIYTHI